MSELAWVCGMNRLLKLFCVFLVLSATVGVAESFRRADMGYKWSFPRDHGRHSDFQTEWWYYTGQLFESEADIFKSKPRYGFQLTFFRRAALVDGSGRDQFMAHAVITDMRLGKTFFSSRVGGAELGLAGASGSSLRVWSGDWSAESIGDDQILRFDVPGQDGEYTVRVSIRELASPWLQGDKGWSRKATCDGCASNYYSLPHLQMTAEVIRNDTRETLRGLGWMDHEFMTNSLAENQVGWDWMGLMLKDGRSLTVYRLRREDGSVDFAAGSLRSRQGERALSHDEFSMKPIATWKSPSSKAAYPIAWRVAVPSEGIGVELSARVQDSELGDARQTQYWEGPVASEGEDVVGYLEMTGYSGRIKF